jgi:hypothetical protein
MKLKERSKAMNKQMRQRMFCGFSLAVVLAAVGIYGLPPHTKVSGQGFRGFVVWVKTAPCSGRTDWISVAQNNPGEGGTGYYEPATLIFASLKCRTGAAGCTFAEAQAEADVVRVSPRFSSYCCREYSVWENPATKAMRVVRGKFGTGGYEFPQLVQHNLCCEEAEALSGKIGLCGGAIHMGARQANFSLEGTNLTYYQRPSVDQCEADCANNAKCKGYTWIQAGTYNPNDAAMCYLASAVTGRAAARGHISGVKGTASGGGGTDTNTPGDDLTGTWVAAYREPLSGQGFHFQLVLGIAAANRWQGTLDYVFVNRPDLSFRAQATVQVSNAGRVRLSYQDPRRGAQQVEGTYTRSQMTFGGSANRITYTRK